MIARKLRYDGEVLDAAFHLVGHVRRIAICSDGLKNDNARAAPRIAIITISADHVPTDRLRPGDELGVTLRRPALDD